MHPHFQIAITGLYRLAPAALADARRQSIRGELLIERTGCAARVLALGTPDEVAAHPAAAAATSLNLPGRLILPTPVNAHTHLDLTHAGEIPHDHDAPFTGWAREVMHRRAGDPDAVAASVRRGVELSLRGGTAAVGDIAGHDSSGPSLVPARVLRDSPLVGISFVELFGIGAREPAGIERIASFVRAHADDLGDCSGSVRVGLQPHAPYSCSLAVFHAAVEAARAHDLSLSTHLAETAEERAFVRDLAGPLADFARELGLWNDALERDLGHGRRPVAHLADILARAHAAGRPFLLAHCADVSNDEIELLVRTGASIAYCPRAGAHFGTPTHLGAHRYGDMLDAGVNVCLGTDSVACLPADQIERNGLSVLDEMRLLYRRDGADPLALLAMATVNGARALGLDEAGFLLAPGSTPLGLVAVPIDDADDPLAGALRSDAAPEPLFVGA